MFALVPIVVLFFVVATSLWVYTDAEAYSERDTPVVLSTDSFSVGTPDAWFFACLLLWIVFFPLYVMGRDQQR
jgi:hypothetical protein